MGLRTHTAVWASLLVLAAYFAGYYALGYTQAKIVVDSLVVGVAVAIAVNWARKAFEHFFSGMRNGTSNLIVGTWGVWQTLLLYFVYVIAFQLLGRPEWLRSSPISGMFSTLFVLCGTFTLLAPVNTTDQLERRSLFGWFVAVAIGSLVAGVLITLALLRVLVLYG